MPRKATVEVQEESQAVQAQAAPVKRGRKTETKTADTPTVKSGRGRKPKDPTATPAQPSGETPKRRTAPTLESVQSDFDSLVSMIETKANEQRQSNGKNKQVSLLRSIVARLKRLKVQSVRISKLRPKVKRNNTKSGFLQPVFLSKDLASFIGQDAATPCSRVAVTRFLCDYIRSHNLQDPQHRKFIQIEKDPKLSALLKHDAKTGPLDYCHIQSCLKKQGHFLPATAPVQESVPAPVATAPKGKKLKA